MKNLEKASPAKQFTILDRQILHQGFFRISRYQLQHSLFKGGMSEPFEREIFERSDAVGILPYDPDKDSVVLIEQFRAGAIRHCDNPWLLEIVAGIIDHEETPEEVAKRELLEESGLSTTALAPVCRYLASPGGSDEMVWLFCGKISLPERTDIFGNSHEHEDIKTHIVSREAAFAMIETGEIITPVAIITLQWLQQNYRKLQEEWGQV